MARIQSGHHANRYLRRFRDEPTFRYSFWSVIFKIISWTTFDFRFQMLADTMVSQKYEIMPLKNKCNILMKPDSKVHFYKNNAKDDIAIFSLNIAKWCVVA